MVREYILENIAPGGIFYGGNIYFYTVISNVGDVEP